MAAHSPAHRRAAAAASLLLCCALLAAASMPRGARAGCPPPLKADRFPVAWGRAGYNGGADSGFPSSLPVVADIKKDFGAKGDGVSDDTAAFAAAGARTFGRAGFIRVPAGTYVITRPLTWTTDAYFLGDGARSTALHFPKPLRDVVGGSSFAYGPWFITVKDAFPGVNRVELAPARLPLRRGDRVLCLQDASKVKATPLDVALYVDDNAGGAALTRAFHNGAAVGGEPTPKAGTGVDLWLKLTARGANGDAGCFALDKPLLYDVPAGWRTRVFAKNGGTFQGVGGVTFSFPPLPYAGHHKEAGRNALLVEGVTNTWFRDLRFVNAEFGMYVANARSSSFTDIVFESSSPTDGFDGEWRFDHTGHYGIAVWRGSYNLIANVFVGTRFVHDVSVTDMAAATVFSSIKGVDLVLDGHRGAPYATLFEDVDVGAGRRPLRCFGDARFGPHFGAFTTLYNVRPRGGGRRVDVAPLQDNLGALMNWVGVDVVGALKPARFSPLGWAFALNGSRPAPGTVRKCFM